MVLNFEQSLQQLLNPKLCQSIATIARQEGQTLLEWVEQVLRDAVMAYQRRLVQKDQSTLHLQTLERLQQQANRMAPQDLPRKVDTVAILEQLREERDAEIIANLKCHRD